MTSGVAIRSRAARPVELLELRPLGRDHRDLGAGQRLDRGRDGDQRRQCPGRVSGRGRVVGVDIGAVLEQPAGQADRRRRADVVGAGLEGEPEEPDPAAGHAADDLVDPLGEPVLVGQVGQVRGGRHVHLEPALDPGRGDRLELLGQAAPAEPEARVEIGRADPRIETDPFEHRPDVGPGLLGQAGHLVGERDLEREECVGAVLDQLGLLEGDQPERAAERPEDLDEDRLGLRIRARRASDDDPGRLGEVGQRGSLAQELGDGEEPREVADMPVAQQPLRRPDRHRAPDDHDRASLEAGDLGQDGLHGADVGVPAVVDRRPDADQRRSRRSSSRRGRGPSGRPRRAPR